jgi:hypothetical protein
MEAENPGNQMSDAERKALWLQEIGANKDIQEFLLQYKSDSVERFLDHYYNSRCQWLDHGPYYLEKYEEQDIRWISLASRYLPVILQKKLFDVQCLWRAEQLEISEVELCCEFLEWEDDILNCPFVEPVTIDDVGLFQEFLLQRLEDDDENFNLRWQDWNEITKSYRDHSDRINFPEWYEFYNIRRGTDSLMLLPNIRGQKEEFYMALAREHRKKQEELKQGQNPDVFDSRQYIYAFGEDLDLFVKRFECAEVQKLYNVYQFVLGKRHKKEDLDYDLNILLEAEEVIPMEANANWKTALVTAARRYARRKTAEALPQAWEQYRINVDLGISFRMSKYAEKGWLKEMTKEWILKGRVLNGEPEDLNF